MDVRSKSRRDESDRRRRGVAVTLALLLVGTGVAPAGALAAQSEVAASHGTEAVAATAANTADDAIGVDSAVEYRGGVEVVFSENVTRASVRNATVTVDGREVDALVEGYGPYWRFSLSRDVPANASVRVDFGDVVTADGRVVRNVSTEVTATSAQVREFGDAMTPADAGRVVIAEPLAFVADDPYQDVAVRDSEGNRVLNLYTIGRAIAIDTVRFNRGEVYEVSFGENRTQYFEVVPLNLSATAEQSVAGPNETVRITAEANRADAPVRVELLGADAKILETERTHFEDGRASVVLSPPAPGNYTATVTDLRTGTVAATETVTVRRVPDRPTSPVDDATPTDPDGDGLYEDLNGNGQIDYADVVAYFDHVGEPPLTDHVGAYDYNGNGDIDYADLVALFEQV